MSTYHVCNFVRFTCHASQEVISRTFENIRWKKVGENLGMNEIIFEKWDIKDEAQQNHYEDSLQKSKYCLAHGKVNLRIF